MIPEIFQSSEPVRHFSAWGLVIGMLTLLLGMNMRVEIKIQKEEEEKK